MRNQWLYFRLFENCCQWSNLNWKAQKALEPFWWLSAEMSVSLCSELVSQDFCCFEFYLISNFVFHVS